MCVRYFINWSTLDWTKPFKSNYKSTIKFLEHFFNHYSQNNLDISYQVKEYETKTQVI